jgi:zinc D-Ala-D-Ala carboxypeptidase
MDKISNHISIAESTRSNTAARLGISNIPDVDTIDNMRKVAEEVFEPLREWVGEPIKINSFYRSPDLNTAIGGSKNSQHCKGQAIDIDDTYCSATNAEMFTYIKNNLDFDQLIWEFGNASNPDWVHVSYVSPEKNRNRILTASKDNNGKTVYSIV